jgi:hypothetical protein
VCLIISLAAVTALAFGLAAFACPVTLYPTVVALALASRWLAAAVALIAAAVA